MLLSSNVGYVTQLFDPRSSHAHVTTALLCAPDTRGSTLQHGLVRASPGAVDERVARTTSAVPPGHLDGATDEQLLERLAELTAHAAVDGEVDRVADDDEEVGEEHQDVGHVVVQELVEAAGYDMKYLVTEQGVRAMNDKINNRLGKLALLYSFNL